MHKLAVLSKHRPRYTFSTTTPRWPATAPVAATGSLPVAADGSLPPFRPARRLPSMMTRTARPAVQVNGIELFAVVEELALAVRRSGQANSSVDVFDEATGTQVLDASE